MTSRSICWCARCGYEGSATLANLCPDCCGWLDRRSNQSALVKFVMLAALALSVALAVLSLTGCSGPHFSAREGAALMSPAGAGGYSITMSQAGAGGAGGSKDYPSAAAGASAGAPPLAAGSGGAPADQDVVHACDRAGWTATAFGWAYVTDAGGIQIAGGPPSAAVDADPRSSWTSGAPQAPGQWFEVDLGEPSTLSEITVRGSDLPAVTLELDGEPVAVSSSSSPGAITIRFAPTTASRLRLELEQPAANWWTITTLAAVCQ